MWHLKSPQPELTSEYDTWLEVDLCDQRIEFQKFWRQRYFDLTKKNTIWILIWRIKKHFYTYLWEPIVKDNKVPELPFHCLTEAIKANSDFDNMFHNFCSAFNWILSLRWGLSCGKEDVKKAAGAEECGPGRRTIPWRKKNLWFDGKNNTVTHNVDFWFEEEKNHIPWWWIL